MMDILAPKPKSSVWKLLLKRSFGGWSRGLIGGLGFLKFLL